MAKSDIKKRAPEVPGQWYQLVDYFDPEMGVVAATPKDLPPVVLEGKIEDVPVIKVPVTVTQSQAARISAVVEEIVGHAPLVITSNVELCKLRPLSKQQADGLMRLAKERAGQ